MDKKNARLARSRASVYWDLAFSPPVTKLEPDLLLCRGKALVKQDIGPLPLKIQVLDNDPLGSQLKNNRRLSNIGKAKGVIVRC